MTGTDIAREYFEAWNRRDFDAIGELVADGAELIDLDGSELRGPDGARQSGELWARAFPDGKIEIVKLAEAGDTVVAELIGRGTNTGPFGDAPATGRSVEMAFADVLTIRNGKIASDHSYGDTASMLRQLGLMPEPAHA